MRILKWFWVFAVAFSLGGGLVASQAQSPTPTPFPPEDGPPQVGLYDLFQLRLEVPGEFDNPYDPAQISVTAIFNAPDGQTFQVPAFFMQPYDDLSGTAQPLGDSEWRVRFTPTQEGEWRYSVEVATPAGRSLLFTDMPFTVTPSESKGFVRVGANGRYFAFDDGSPYFPIGQNLGWSWEGGGGLEAYLGWLDQLAANGANYARLFLDTAWFIGLDWVRPAGDYTASQGQAWMMDQIVEAAQERGIYLQVVLIWHQAFIQSPGLPVNPPEDVERPNTEIDFDSHAYNQANGGPLSRPESLFANTLVKGLLEQKLRYMLARWGYSPHIFAWEVVTDVDRLPNYDPAQHLGFINDLATFVRQNDPYAHLVTAGSRALLPELVTNPLFDFAQVRVFQSRPIEEAPDQVSSVLNALYDPLLQTAQKPILLTEFSLNPWFEPTADDPGGLHFQQTLWAVALSGASGTGMSQWWDTYIDAQDLYSAFYPLSRFVDGLNWPALNLQPLQVGLVDSRGDTYQPLRIENFNRNFRGQSPFDTVYTLTADGPLPSTQVLSSYLYGSQFNAQASFPQTFIISPPVDTILSIGIRDVAPNGTAALVLTLDNQPYATLNLTQGSANTQLDIPLPAGYHRLVLDNAGEDWIELNYLEIADYIAPLRAVALADSSVGTALIWLHHRAYTWQNAQTQSDWEAQRFSLTVPQMPPGDYMIEFWDTTNGAILGQEVGRVGEADNGVLTVQLLPIQTTLAIRITQIRPGAVLSQGLTPIPTRTPAVQASFTPSPTASPTLTPSATTTVTPSPTTTPTVTASPTITPSPSASATPSATPSAALLTATPELPDPTLTPAAGTLAEVTPDSGAAASPTDGFIPRFTRTPRPTANAP